MLCFAWISRVFVGILSWVGMLEMVVRALPPEPVSSKRNFLLSKGGCAFYFGADCQPLHGYSTLLIPKHFLIADGGG